MLKRFFDIFSSLIVFRGNKISLDGKKKEVELITKIFQGMIEKSNVNPVQEMTQLIQSQRMFEQNLKAIKTYDSLMSKEANEVGKL